MQGAVLSELNKQLELLKVSNVVIDQKQWDKSATLLHNVVPAEYLRCIQNLVSTIYVLNGQYPTPFIF